MDLTHMWVLTKMLSNSEIPFQIRKFCNGIQIVYPNNDNRVLSAVTHSFSYGNEFGLIEIMGLLTEEEQKFDSVVGNLTAIEVYRRISKHWKNI